MFVHLRVHSDFSVVDGTARIDPLVQAAAADGQPALALTDLNNMFGAIKFYGAARRAGLKPILGVEVMLTGLPGQSERAAAAAHGHSQQPAPKVLLLAQNATGYHHLCLLLSAMWTTHQGRDQPVLDWSDLCAHHEGLVLLSGAQAGPIGAALLAGDEDKASEWATCMAQVFAHRFYLEVQRAGRSQDEAHVQAAARLAARLGLPLVATHPVQFVHADDYDSHEARVCIAEGDMLGNRRRVRRFTREQHLLSAQEMQARFADLPSAVANAVHLAARCSLTLTLGQPQLPRFPTPLRDGQPLPVGQHLREVAFEGLTQRLQQLYPDAATRQAKQAAYEERLAFEIDTIDAMGFAGYFLIVGDFVNWARGHGCPVGPGRGSGAGSLVAYALRITDLDPLRYNLLFERFLNPERVSMPDFDIDFCQANRDRVIEYVKNRYGRDAVSQIATFGTMAARAAVRDVGRVLDMSYTFCDGVAKLIPNKPGQHITIADALRDEPALAERAGSEEEVGELLRMAQKLEGVTRNVGMHAGGVLIAPGKLTDFCPLYQQPGSQSAVSQFDKDDVEAAGLVKFDFLGLATLTILQIATDFLRASHPSMADFSFDNVPLDDAKVYALFGRGQTEAVFQFESRGMQGMLRDAKPQRLEDLIALNALFRPGPMELIPTYIARKHGRETVVYPHPSLEPILSETFGIMVYQEQVMQVAQVMAGYSLGGADMLRRAMGKKKPEEMAKQRDIFLRGAEQKDIDAKVAGEVFDLMESFAGYGFNKSHAAAYSLLAYHTAWLKVHHPAVFFAANMTVEIDDTDKLRQLVADAKAMGVSFELPDINRGHYRFEPVDAHTVRYGLGAIKGTGEQAVEAVVAAREAGGDFVSVFDLVNRVDAQRINRRTFEALIKAGALDSLNRNRASLLASLERAMEYAAAQAANVHQVGLFDMGDNMHGASTREPDLVSALPWPVRECLMHEKTALGFFMSAHLFDEHATEARALAPTTLAQLGETRDAVRVVGLVTELRQISTGRGRMVVMTVEDDTGHTEVMLSEEMWQARRQWLREDEWVVLQVTAQPDRGGSGLRVRAQAVWSLPQARCRFGKYLRVEVNGHMPDVAELVREFPPQREASDEGELVRGLGVQLHLQRDGAACDLQLDERARFYPTDEALRRWAAQAANACATVVY